MKTEDVFPGGARRVRIREYRSKRTARHVPAAPLRIRRPGLRDSIRPLLVCGCVLAAVIGAGCKHVSPWERGALADPVMRADRDPVGEMMSEHIWFSREAATGGRGVGGGGCGCN